MSELTTCNDNFLFGFHLAGHNINMKIMRTQDLRVVLSIVNFFLVFSPICSDDSIDTEGTDRFKIEGKVTLTDARNSDWLGVTRVLVDGGDYIGYLR